jgi:hypothetical protein
VLLSQICVPILVVLLFIIGSSLGMPYNKIIPASDVLAKIKAGESADFDNCTIAGDLNLSALKIEGPVHFNNIYFKNSVSFKSTAFNDVADFSSSKFNSTADFRFSEFNSIVDFSSSNFSRNAYFISSKFNGNTNFISSKFNGNAYFISSKFNGNTNFISSKFNGNAYFISTKFNGDADFGSSKFNGDADFRSSKFNSTAYFISSKFNSTAYFSSSKFNSDAYFSSSIFNGDADFGSSKFNGDAYFRQSNFNKAIGFANSKTKNAFFENSIFTKNSKLFLQGAEYDKLYIRWYNISDIDYDDTVYVLLIKNFNNLGFFEDADNCYYQYRIEHRSLPWPGLNFLDPIDALDASFRNTIDFFSLIFYGYGVEPLYPVAWSIFFMVLFGIIWNKAGMPAPLRFSMRAFLSGTKLFIDSPIIPKKLKASHPSLEAVLTAEKVLGALFSLLLFLAVSKTIIR